MEIAVLGPLSARVGQASVVPSAAKPRQVLALLALNCGHPVSVSSLVDELWGDRPPRSAEATLHTYVKQLRRMIGAALAPDDPRGPRDVLRRVHTGYRLDGAAGGTDAAQFERLTLAGRSALERGAEAAASTLLIRALGLWRGPVLADVALGPVLRAEALRLEELRLMALEERFGAELRRGRHRTLIGELAALTSRFPLHENLHAQLMLALYRSGRTGQALEVYRRLRHVLADELGLEPSTQVRRLHEALLRGDPVLDSPAAAPRGDLAPPAGPGRGREDVPMPTVPGSPLPVAAR
ncbi:AfsR/SARP family transcriptional regulator [Streptomyces sp. NPDC002896]|uniref:AfsR/SARP family transcriptional regulator n=1 Tax=Streptomyces sp. NPDC002896 TaxID=3154438 RepID=UPI003333EAD2